MNTVEQLIQFNKQFVAEKRYQQYSTDSTPNKKLAILSCMDTRLTELLPAALNIKNGDAKIIKNAGGIITHPFGSIMRSLLVAVYDLGVEEILVIGHDDCGMQCLNAEALTKKMLRRGISQEYINMIKYCGINLDTWLQGFSDVQTSIKNTMDMIINHPLMAKDVKVYGFIMDPLTGSLTEV